jgi:hypothetical protein
MMWVEIKRASSLMLAEMWKEFIESNGVPTHILAVTGEAPTREQAAYQVLVPKDKKHVVEEILKTL